MADLLPLFYGHENGPADLGIDGRPQWHDPLSMNHLKLTMMFTPCEEGGFFAQFAEIPAVFSEGETQEEAKANLCDALNEMSLAARERAVSEMTQSMRSETLELIAS